MTDALTYNEIDAIITQLTKGTKLLPGCDVRRVFQLFDSECLLDRYMIRKRLGCPQSIEADGEVLHCINRAPDHLTHVGETSDGMRVKWELPE